MLPLRRLALRALTSSTSSAVAVRASTRSFHTPHIFSSPCISSTAALLRQHPGSLPATMSIRRTYATEAEEENSRAAAESGEQSSTIGDAVEDAQDKIESARDSVADSISSATDAVTPETPASSAQPTPIRTESIRAAPPEPGTNLYIGNLFFEVSEDQLRSEFSRFGELSSVKIIYDGRGLSKGFGYIVFKEPESATEARNALNGQVFQGRRLAVQFAIKSQPQGRAPGDQAGVFRNPPSKTLFIGNMSYEMSDKDLNDLFRQIKNVLDVRVAIDRRTGQPRGFAHADFVDTSSAEEAAEFLKGKEFYGRRLRVDYSSSNRNI